MQRDLSICNLTGVLCKRNRINMNNSNNYHHLIGLNSLSISFIAIVTVPILAKTVPFLCYFNLGGRTYRRTCYLYLYWPR